MSSSDDSDFVVLANNDLTDYNDAGYLPQESQTLAAIQEWLSPTKYLSENSEYRKHLNSHLEGTGHWFQSSKPYREWHDSPNIGALWVKAIAGAGKSVLAASTAAKLAREEQVPVVFFFFRQIVALNHEPKYLMRDWLSQLLPYSPWLQSKLKSYVKDHVVDINTISLDELWRHICDALSFMPKAYCIADALDEMDHNNESFLEKLISLGQQKPGSIKLLLTSRPVPRIENLLRPQVSQVRLDPKEVEGDVDLYVECRLKPIGGPPTFYETLKPIICRRAQGLFLYARLVTDELIEAVKDVDITPSDIPRIVESVPDSLEDVYNKMLTEHSKRSGVSRKHQLTILQWVTHSTRPLRLIEVAEVMKAIGGAGETLKETKALVRAACGPLLEVLEDETLSVLHHSFTEYLTQADRDASHFPIIAHGDAHHLIAMTCVAYLCNGCLDDWELQEDAENEKMNGKKQRKEQRNSTGSHQEIKLSHPLLDYAVDNWHRHTSKATLDEPLTTSIDSFMQPHNHAYKAWLELGIQGEAASSFTTVHSAAWAGIADYLRHLIRSGEPANEKDCLSRTPMSYAASQGHSDATAALLEAQIDANVDDKVGWRPIHYAAMTNRYMVVRLLLAAGVDPRTGKSREHPGRRCGNAPITTGTTALKYAVQAGHVETVLELVPYLNKDDLERALHWAAKSARAGVVAALLELPEVNVDHEDEEYDHNDNSIGCTALFQATICRDPGTMRALIDKGARISACFPRSIQIYSRESKTTELVGDSMMHAFCGKYRGHEQISEDSLKEAFNLLIDAGCEVDLLDDTGKTPLLYACSQMYGESSPPLILMLLRAGADASKSDRDGSTVLHLYNNGDSPEVVDALVEHGADVNAVIHRGPLVGHSAIHTMIENWNDKVILRFLEKDPNVNVRNLSGDTALHLNSKRSNNRSTAVVEKLLEIGADVNSRNNDGQTPMHLFSASHSFSGCKDDVAKLIAAGADLDAADNQGRTMLSLALRQYRPRDGLGAILDLGANINVRDLEGRSILHLAIAFKVDPEVIEFLAQRGADSLATDNFKNTLFHEIARQGKAWDEKKQADQFLAISKLGLPSNAKNHAGQTPLHISAGTYGSGGRGGFSPLGFFLDESCGINVNDGDNLGVRPLHLAASISESQVVQLLKAGADPYALTLEGQSALHVAARGRQSNIVGLLVQRYRDDGRLDFINIVDARKRSSLHDACRSGRPESVRILLEAGARTDQLDVMNRSPLHVCAEILEERIFWRKDTIHPAMTRRLNAANVLIGDALRPHYTEMDVGTHTRYDSQYEASQEEDLLRIREILRLLYDRASQQGDTSAFSGRSVLELAISKACSPMVDELLELRKIGTTEDGHESPSPKLRLQQRVYVQTIDMALKNLHELSPHPRDCSASLKDLMKELLVLGHDHLVPELQKLGWDFIEYAPGEYHEDNKACSAVHWLANKGYAHLLEHVGAGVNRYDDVAWAEAMEKEKGLRRGTIRPILPDACSRTLPNLHTIKALVKLGVDVNAQPRSNMYLNASYQDVINASSLHILAESTYWWQTEALEFLLQRGANTESRNERGQTPLQVALTSEKASAVTTLLKYGADPNAVSDSGETCMNCAINCPPLIKLLLEHGADIKTGSRPPLLDAVKSQNLRAVKTLLAAGADANLPLIQEKEKEKNLPYSAINAHELSALFPLHQAAFVETNNSGSKLKKNNAVALMELLLENGADPYRVIDGRTTIIHDIFFQAGAAVAPLLSRADLRLEHRDAAGRTLLLIACKRSSLRSGTCSVESGTISTPDLITRLIDRGADITATDNDGQGVLHLLISCWQYHRKDNLYALNLFIERNKDLILRRDNENWTPLHRALKARHWDAARVLIDAGADLNEPDPAGNTALHHLSSSTKDTEHKLFAESLTKGIAIDARNNAGETPLFTFFAKVSLTGSSHFWDERSSTTVLAEMTSRFEAVFLANGAKVTAKDNEGKGLLHVIAKRPMLKDRFNGDDDGNNIKKLFQILVDMGLDPWQEDLRQMTPLDVASVCGNEDILAMFRRDK